MCRERAKPSKRAGIIYCHRDIETKKNHRGLPSGVTWHPAYSWCKMHKRAVFLIEAVQTMDMRKHATIVHTSFN